MRPKNAGQGSQLYDTDKTMISVLSKTERNQQKGMPAWKNAYEDLGAPGPMETDDSVLLINKNQSRGSVLTANSQVGKAKRGETSGFQLFRLQDRLS